MSDELRARIAAYKTAMSIIKEMLKTGVLIEQDYALVEAKIALFYGINLTSIFR